MDGVTRVHFERILSRCVRDICPWRDMPHVCSDENNSSWGKLRNNLADYQVTALVEIERITTMIPGCMRYPEFYCLIPTFGIPELLILKLPIAYFGRNSKNLSRDWKL